MKILNQLIQTHFDTNMSGKPLFVVDVSGRDISETYLNSFTSANAVTFRDPDSNDKNCTHCKNFIRRYGNIVTLDGDLNIITLFDIDFGGHSDVQSEYGPSIEAMKSLVKSGNIVEPFIEDFSELNSLPYESVKKSQEIFALGVKKNAKVYTKEEANKYPNTVETGKAYDFFHMAISVPREYVNFTGKSKATLVGDIRTTKEVFKRGLEELRLDSLELVRDLALQGSLLDIGAHLPKVEGFIAKMKAYNDVPFGKKDNWCWENVEFQYARFKSELIGVLCTELSEGEDLNKAVQNWNKRVDPANYMKAVAPITKAQVKMAQKFVEDNGYADSFDRRFATTRDVSRYIEEVLHVNTADEGSKVSNVSMFDSIPTAKKSSHSRNKFDGVEEISIDKFREKVLPNARSVEVFMENCHTNNLSALFCPNVVDSKPIFKYPNNFSFTNIGNTAGKSEIKDAVLSQGGKSGVLRFSIMWAEGNQDNSDLDAHCQYPGGEIYFSRKTGHPNGGNLDIDITDPQHHKRGGKSVVENINFPDWSAMKDGNYTFFVRNFANRGSKGFSAEIEVNGDIFSYTYKSPLRGKEDVKVATVYVKNGVPTITHHLPEENSSREVWDIETNEFHKVNLLCHSPNHWGESKIGNKHYMFFLEGCKADKSLRTFHNVDLISELQEHRKVLDVLGNTQMASPTENNSQLCGLAFNSTVRNTVVVRVKGTHQRLLKIKF